MTTNNSLDPYNNENRWFHEKERQHGGGTQAPYSATHGGNCDACNHGFCASNHWSAPPIKVKQAPRKRMAVDLQVCLAVLVVCVAILAFMAHG